MKRFVFTTFLLLFSVMAFAQGEKKPADRNIWNIEFTGTADLPMADMAKRFGYNFRLGGGFSVMTGKKWIFGSKVLFIVGNQMKDSVLLSNLVTEENLFIDQNGELKDVALYERGYMIGLSAGKVLPYLQVNQNSGLTVETGLGFIQHKVNIHDRDQTIPQIWNEYKKGYDRLTNGLYLKQFVGYTLYPDNKVTNIRVGLDFVYGFTAGRRSWQFDLEKADTAPRNDILTGISFTWLIPIMKKVSEETYY